MNKRSHIVYLLWDPRNGDIRYVGKTCSPERRFSKHRCGNHTMGHVRNWEKSLVKLGLCCEWAIVEDGLTDDEVGGRERWWITYGRQYGWPLTNLTDGGDGMFGHIPSMETREKVRRARLGKKMSLEQKEKLRQIQLKKWDSPEYRENARRTHLGSRASAETREIMSRAQFRRQERERRNAGSQLWVGEMWREPKEET